VNPHSGYGGDGIGLAQAFIQAGVDVYLDPAAVQAPLPPEVAELLCKRLDAPFDMLLHHWDPPNLGISRSARTNSVVTVAHTMWEMTTLDNCDGRSSLRKRLKDYDLVVGYDSVTTTGLDPYVSTNAATVQGGYWPRKWPQQHRDWHAKTLRFCMVGALGPRKDPFVAIDAFRELREEQPELDIELHVKTVTPGLHSKMQDLVPGLHLYYDVWPEHTMREFYTANHVLLAPSRGEGKNLPALEMLSTGGTVIGTNWGGHTQWLSSAYAYPLDYKLEPLLKSRPQCQWAKASKDHLKQLMIHCYQHRSELERKGDLAANIIPNMCSWPKVIDRLMDKVGELDERGERVLHKYRVAKARAQEEAVLL
jgi:glycosyltransferase involved in cell wall biosynthesis